MTTTVTLKTHDWPVKVKTTVAYERETGSHHSTTIERVAPQSERGFTISQGTSIEFTELPLPEQPEA